MASLYGHTRRAVERDTDADAMFFDEAVANSDADTPFFVDMMHPAPEGERVLAERYFEHIVEGVESERYFKKDGI